MPFILRHKACGTSVSTKILELKDRNSKFSLKLDIVYRTQPYTNIQCGCELCCAEIYEIFKCGDKQNLINNKLGLRVSCVHKITHSFKYFRNR